jgi:uncharacterized protein YndB with AHSA1/START domain
MSHATTTTVTTELIEAEVRIAAPPAQVWLAITEGIGGWWPHRFQDEGSSVHLEPVVGGRFHERFDAIGGGALYATVTYVEPERILKLSGPMGLPGAALYVKTFRLSSDTAGTLVRTTSAMLGSFDEEVRAGYQEGNQAVVQALKTYVEAPSLG